VTWNTNRWGICDSAISSLLHLPGGVVAAAAANGSVYILRNDVESPVEAFRPALGAVAGPVTIAGVPGAPTVFITQGGPELYVWDIETLLLVRRIGLPAAPAHLAVVGHSLFCALEDGTVLRMATEDGRIEATMVEQAGRRIVRIGEHKEMLYSVLDDGTVWLWGERPALAGWRADVDIVLHAKLEIAANMMRVAVSIQGRDGSEMGRIVHTATPVRCCLDEKRPLLAVGYEDGSVGVWRVPVP
jgi:hypothetical protein